jgi:peptidoglycan/xylan/chitin deacetylase (PgdA/CDA1 family)
MDRFVNNAEEFASPGLKSLARHIGLSALARFGEVTGKTPAFLRRKRVQFLYLHHVFKDEEEGFRRILGRLSRDHTFISYSDAVDRIISGNIDRPYLVLSFDDGIKNCLRAARIMSEFNIKACFFICPEMIGEADYHKIKLFCQERLHKPPLEFLSWSEVEQLLKEGHEIGSHTMTHPNLSHVSVQEMHDEIGGSFELLTRRIGRIKHFSWPLGRFFHFNLRGAKMVFDLGYQSCASAERGCHISNHSKKTSELCIRRDHIMARWPIGHILYFMARNCQVFSEECNEWPRAWRENLI